MLLVIDRPFVIVVLLLVCLEGGLALRTVVPKLMGCVFRLGPADADGRRPPGPDGRVGVGASRRRAESPEFVLRRVIWME